MSSIYGFLHCASYSVGNREAKERGLSAWNRDYGKENDVFSSEKAFLGSYVEHFSEKYGAGKPLIEVGNKVFLTDALIYNRDELLPKIGETVDSTLSDEELMIRLITEIGFDAIAEVNGDFAGAVYDKDNGTLTLYRDHTGVRQLYYYEDKNQFAFSSDIRGLGALPDADLTIDEEILWMGLAGMNNQSLDRTDFKYMHCVLPGSIMTVKVGETIGKEVTRYWKPGQKKIRLDNDEAYIKEMRRLVEDAIKRRADAFPGTIGAELSGGLDSSVIDILLNRLGRQGKYIAWRTAPDDWPLQPVDERRVILDVCEQEGITCEFLPEKREEVSPDAVWPVFHNTVSCGQVAKSVSEAGCRCVFSGQGGDEGVSHRANVLELWHHKEYGSYFREVWANTKGKSLRLIRFPYYIVKDIFVNYPKKKKPRTFDHNSLDLLNPQFVEKMRDVKGFPYWFGMDEVREFEQGGIRLRPETVTYQAAPFGVRYVFPFQDYRVFDYAVSIPRNLYRRNGKDRWIYRMAFDDLMPQTLREVDYKNFPSIDGKEDELRKMKQKQAAEKPDEQKIMAEMKEYIRSVDYARYEKYLNPVILNNLINIDKNNNIQDVVKGVGICMRLTIFDLYRRFTDRCRIE